MKTTLELTPLLTRFVDSMNTQDTATFVPCFAPDAVVEDEGHTYRGTAEIKAWIENAFAKYRPILDVTAATINDGSAVITGTVSGSFDGSPIVLNYHFTLAGDRISALRCAV